MPTSARDSRHAGVVPVPLRRRARAHTVSAANGSAATVMSATPVKVPSQRCHPSAMPPPIFAQLRNLPGPGGGRSPAMPRGSQAQQLSRGLREESIEARARVGVTPNPTGR